MIFQENHTFDNYFETFPGVNSSYVAPLNTCLPYNLSDPAEGCEQLYNGDHNQSIVEKAVLPHNQSSSAESYDNGKMDGFVAATPTEYQSSVMSYFTAQSVPLHWDMASHFALDANFFSSIMAYSYPNHLASITGVGSYYAPPRQVLFNLTMPTIFNELTAKKISWGWYSGNFNDSLQCQNLSSILSVGPNTTQEYQYFWNVLEDFPSIQDNPATCHNLMGLPDFFESIASGKLAAVTWITPNMTVSEHPQGSTLLKSEEYVGAVINDIEASPFWNSTAIFWTNDEYGGFYDNVVPPQVDAYGYGFRVPLIVISPYVKTGIFYGDPYGQPEDFGALLSTIESNWGLSTLGDRDSIAAPLWYMFNFHEIPRTPLFTEYGVKIQYPVSKCVKDGLCSTRTPFPAPPWQQQGNVAKNYVYPPPDSDGDPYD